MFCNCIFLRFLNFQTVLWLQFCFQLKKVFVNNQQRFVSSKNLTTSHQKISGIRFSKRKIWFYRMELWFWLYFWTKDFTSFWTLKSKEKPAFSFDLCDASKSLYVHFNQTLVWKVFWIRSSLNTKRSMDSNRRFQSWIINFRMTKKAWDWFVNYFDTAL